MGLVAQGLNLRWLTELNLMWSEITLVSLEKRPQNINNSCGEHKFPEALKETVCTYPINVLCAKAANNN